MTPIFIVTTLAVVIYSLWVRRHTWWSRWEAGATLAIAMEGCGLLLLTPWTNRWLSPPLHEFLGLWNVPQVLGIFCLLVGVIANVYHMLVRLTDPGHVPAIMRRHLQVPLGAGTAVMVVSFCKSERGFEPDIFARLTGDGWLTTFEVAAGALVLYLTGYVGRLMWSLRHDNRARETLVLYLAATLCAVAGGILTTASILSGSYIGPAIWAFLCLSVGTFAYGLARSWQAKRAWFSPDSSARR